MTNQEFNTWLDNLNNKRREYYNNNFSHREYTPIVVEEGTKYIKLISDTSVWGFVSKTFNPKKGYKVGDLLKAQSWSTPAKHSRGNLLEGTDQWDYWGPIYLN